MSRTEDLRAAWDLVSQLPQETLDAVALIVDNSDVKSDYNGRDEEGGSFLQEDARATLTALAATFHRMRELHHPENVQDPF